MPQIELKPGQRVFVKGEHPLDGHAGTLVVYERFGWGDEGWKVRLDDGGEFYAYETDLQPAP